MDTKEAAPHPFTEDSTVLPRIAVNAAVSVMSKPEIRNGDDCNSTTGKCEDLCGVLGFCVLPPNSHAAANFPPSEHQTPLPEEALRVDESSSDT